MAVTGSHGLGVPTTMLHEGEGFFVTVETRLGELYRGLLTESEDNWNLHMKNVMYTDSNGKTAKMEKVFIRGSQIRFVVLPEPLSNAPIFRRVERFKESKGKYVPAGGGVEKFVKQHQG